MTDQEISKRIDQAQAIARLVPPPANALAEIKRLAAGVPAPYDQMISSLAEAVMVGTPING